MHQIEKFDNGRRRIESILRNLILLAGIGEAKSRAASFLKPLRSFLTRHRFMVVCTRRGSDMAGPVVVCSVCGKEVSKRQTYSVGDGKRACRIHEGVAEKKDEMEKERKAKRQEEMRLAEEKARRVYEEHYPHVPKGPWCWCCHKEGISEKEFWTLIAIGNAAINVKEKRGEPVPKMFTQEYTEALRRLSGVEPGTVVIQLFEAKPGDKVFGTMDYNGKQAAGIAGVVCVCMECALKAGLKREMPAVDIPTLLSVGEVMGPVFEKIAENMLNLRN